MNETSVCGILSPKTRPKFKKHFIVLKKFIQLILYADDSAILFTHNNPDVISSKLGNVLEKFSDWLINNKLSLHLGKTECMLFGPHRKIKQIANFQVKCYDHVINSTQQML